MKPLIAQTRIRTTNLGGRRARGAVEGAVWQIRPPSDAVRHFVIKKRPREITAAIFRINEMLAIST
jgi:hypothetical protein